ncbi:MarR family winged helix-turn-helix transcriptional regulator [Streptomyces asoensis]|uniref:MarR family winged helix-turn-helix transcriptional regulator n=1 Tax=Streptomyces asoensis TaxID=249586 RepID=UPI0037BC52E3
MSPSPSAVPPASPAVVELEQALSRVAYLRTGARRHDRLIAVAGVPLDRAAVAMLRQIADHEPLRPGELAQVLAVQASHVTRQVQRLGRSGHLTRVADADDPRVLRIRLTPLGEEAVARLGDAGARGVRLALADWSPDELRSLAVLVRRLVDVFLTHPADEGQAPHEGTTPPAP